MRNRSDCTLQRRAERIIRGFIMKYQPCTTLLVNQESASVNEDYSVLLIGVNALSLKLLQELITMGQFENHTFHALLLDDRDYQGADCGAIAKGITVAYKQMSTEVEILIPYISERIQSWNQIILCTESVIKNKIIEDRLKRLCTSCKGKPVTWLQRKKPCISSVSMQGKKDGFSELTFDLEDIERLAREIYNNYYLYRPVKVPWSKLDIFEKEANINSAMHIFTKLYMVGLQIEKKGNTKKKKINSRTEYVEYLGPERIEKLSKMEHMRWCAFYFGHGWTTASMSEKGWKIKDKVNRKHVCLVPWEELSQISERIGIDYKKLDRDIVLHIYDYVEHIGCQIIRK